MDHQPEATFIIALSLDERVSAAERRKLDHAFITADNLQALVTERRQFQVRRCGNRRTTVPATSGHRSAKSSEDPASYARILQGGRFHVEANRQHAATYITTDSLRINQPRGRDNHADATSVARYTSGITATCCTSGTRRRRSIASDTSCFIGAVSHVRMGGSDGMAICERQVECPLDLSTELTRLSFSLPT